VRLWYNERMRIVHIGPGGPAHLPSIDVAAGTACLPGDRIAADTLTLIPVADTPERLEQAKTIQISRINNRREREIESGFAYSGHTWDCDDRAQMAILMRALLLIAGTALPVGFTWRDADNNDVAMTGAEFRAFVGALVSHVAYCYDNARALKNQTKNATTVAEVIAIDVASGW
jgi:hypothetical protein